MKYLNRYRLFESDNMNILELRDKANSMLSDNGMSNYYRSGGSDTTSARKFVDFIDKHYPATGDKSLFETYGNNGDNLWRLALQWGRFDVAD